MTKRFTLNAKRYSKSFTLIELLVVIGIIAILAATVIIAINPARQLAQARNAKRRSDLRTLLDASYQYGIAKGGDFSTLNLTMEARDVGTRGHGNVKEDPIFEIWSRNVSAYGVTTDSEDNVIVTGYSSTIKYSKDGEIIWERGFYGQDIAIDSEDNVIITGYNLTTKYLKDGTEIWSNSFAGVARAVAVDSEDNVIITGNYANDFYTIKYLKNGDVLWERSYVGGSSYGPDDVAIDSEDNVIVTGASRVLDRDNFLTIKYTNNGDIIWEKREVEWWSYSLNLKVDSQDNIIVVGEAYGGEEPRWGGLIIKYDKDRNKIWEKFVDDPEDCCGFSALVLDRDDNPTIHTVYRGILKFSKNGDLLWQEVPPENYRGNPDGYGAGKLIAIDSENNLLFPLQSTIDGGRYLVKYGLTGLKWSNLLGPDYLASIPKDPQGSEEKTRYEARMEGERITLRAIKPELGEKIEITR